MELEFYTLNVFSDQGIKGGNQLAVIPKAENLSTEEMLTITKQFNYSESTFITKYSSNGGTVRIFVPEYEMPFAGHPTIGTAYIMEKIWRENNAPRSEMSLSLNLGPIKVSIEGDPITMVSMDQFLPKEMGIFEKRRIIADLLGLQESDLMKGADLMKISPSEFPFLFVPLKSAKLISELRPNIQGMIEKFGENQLNLYIFAIEEDGTIRARFFAPGAGIVEDPATGSAQASLALALYLLGKIPENAEFVTKQGYEMGRPSNMYNYAKFEDGKMVSCFTGGNNHLVSRGKLFYE